ncbi:MAG: hypothetical protein KDK53_13565 [Maritimibacter sp.]|nr:hypothetical protein [Maritimibacter sp.]
MTTSAYTPAPTYTISGIGPYDAPFEYTASSEIEVYYTDGDGIAVAAAPADFSVVPEGPTTSGTVFLTPAAATAHDGETLTVQRAITVDQAWQGLGSTASELEDQLDSMTRAIQGNTAEIALGLNPNGIYRPNITELQVDSTLTYATGEISSIVAGRTIRTLTEGFIYEVAESAATDHHLTTAGGVKLYVRPIFGKLNVRAFGALGDGVANDAPAFQTAVDAIAALYTSDTDWPQLVIPSGNYLLTDPVSISRNMRLEGDGFPRVLIGHTGAGFVLNGIPSAGFFPRGKIVFNGIYFTTAGAEPLCIIQNGLPDALTTDPTYLYSQNDTEISSCVFDAFTADHAVLNYRGFNVNFNSCTFTSLTVNESAVELKQSNSDKPYWSYAFNFNSCNFTNISGNGIAIRAESGDVFVHGGVIEGCAGDAVVLTANAGYVGYPTAGFFGVYFEANTGDHVNAVNRSGAAGFYSCKFVSGGFGSSFTFTSGFNATFHACITPNNPCSFDGGNIDLYRCSYMYGDKTLSTALRIHDHVFQTGLPTTPQGLNKQLRVNSQLGGAAIVLCTHYENAVGVNGTVTELFMIRFGVANDQFEAVSLGRSTGSLGTATFTFSVDADKFLQVEADKDGTAKYQIVSHNEGSFLPV